VRTVSGHAHLQFLANAHLLQSFERLCVTFVGLHLGSFLEDASWFSVLTLFRIFRNACNICMLAF